MYVCVCVCVCACVCVKSRFGVIHIILHSIINYSNTIIIIILIITKSFLFHFPIKNIHHCTAGTYPYNHSLFISINFRATL